MISIENIVNSDNIQKVEETKLIHCYRITLPWNFYLDYIINKLGKKLVKYVENQYKGQDLDERFIEAYSITYSHELVCYYGELLLLDIGLPDNKLLPVNFPMINTSSPYAFTRCSIEPDDFDESDESDNSCKENKFLKSKDDIIELCTKTVSNIDEINKLLDKIVNE